VARAQPAIASSKRADPPLSEEAFGRKGSLDTGKRARPRVLIVEDHADTREIYAWCMRAAGWHVDTVTNGLEAIVMAAATQPEVIVMDLNLPVLDGVSTTRSLKRDERTAHIPVVACTAYGRQRRAEMREVGFEEVVPKPCSAEYLRDIVEMVARRAR
jgi:two-component system phosphate regulon response regulator PhoB